MKTRKSYVGYVIRMPGQRDPLPGDVAFRDPHEHLVVLPMTNVMSVCRFDPEVYAATERSWGCHENSVVVEEISWFWGLARRADR